MFGFGRHHSSTSTTPQSKSSSQSRYNMYSSTNSNNNDYNSYNNNNFNNNSTPESTPRMYRRPTTPSGQYEMQQKKIIVQSSNLHRKREYTFNYQSFADWLHNHNLRGLVCVKPNPNPTVINDFNELKDGFVYRKQAYSFWESKLGLNDAGYTGVKYVVDNMLPPLFNFLEELNFTISNSILNDSAYKLSTIASELLDGSVLRIKPDWTVIIDFIVLLSCVVELHFVMDTFKQDPYNTPNFIIFIACSYGLYYVLYRRYDWLQSDRQYIDEQNRYNNNQQHQQMALDNKYYSRPFYHQYTETDNQLQQSASGIVRVPRNDNTIDYNNHIPTNNHIIH